MRTKTYSDFRDQQWKVICKEGHVVLEDNNILLNKTPANIHLQLKNIKSNQPCIFNCNNNIELAIFHCNLNYICIMFEKDGHTYFPLMDDLVDILNSIIEFGSVNDFSFLLYKVNSIKYPR